MAQFSEFVTIISNPASMSLLSLARVFGSWKDTAKKQWREAMAIILLCTLIPTLLHAAPDTCSESFKERTRKFWGITVQKTKQAQDKIKLIQSKISVDQWLYRVTTPKSKFDAAKFSIAKARFLYLKPEFVRLEHLQSVEELLAFIEVNSQIKGHDMVSMLAWREYNWPAFARYIQRIEKFDLSRGIYVEHIEDWIFESYWAVHAQSYINFDDIKNKTSSEKLKSYIKDRSNYEVARSGLIRALKETGIVRDDNFLQKILRTIKTSQSYRIMVNMAVKAPFYFLTNTPLVAKLPLNQVIPFLKVPPPLMLNIRHNIISEETIEKSLLNGIDSMIPEIEKEISYAPRWDNGVRFVQKTLFVSSLIAQAFLYPQLIAQAYQLNVEARNLTAANKVFEFSYPSNITKWEMLSASTNLPVVGNVEIKTPVLKEWSSVKLKVNHIYIGNPIYLIKPKYGRVSDMTERFNNYSENYFKVCESSGCSSEYNEAFLEQYLKDLPSILPPGREDLAELIRAATLFKVKQLDRASLANEYWMEKYQTTATTTLDITMEYNEFDRLYEASFLSQQIGKPVPSAQPIVK